MITADWVSNARRKQEILEELIGSYHPSTWSEADPPKRAIVDLPITARDAEAACGLIREKIAEEEKGERQSPVMRFRAALDAGDVSTLMSLLNSAWFGVPESRSCWSIRGFAEAVELLGDPPEDGEEAPDGDL